MKSSYYKTAILGIDIGGTKIKAGAVVPDGTIIGKPVTVETGGNDRCEEIFARITGTLDQVIDNKELEDYHIAGIGMGVTGPLDNSTGTILECPQLPTMHFFPLKDKITERFMLPVYMDNDANALVLGESVWGAGKGHTITIGFTLGTGLGCAIVTGNRLFTGANGLAGEIWPSSYEDCTIEDLVSGRGISAVYFRLTNQNCSARDIAQIARNGNKEALETWNIFGDALGKAVAWGINMIDPGIVILGGSIANSMDLFYDSMISTMKRFICPVPAEKTRVVMAELGDNAGFIGAAALALQEMKSI